MTGRRETLVLRRRDFLRTCGVLAGARVLYPQPLAAGNRLVEPAAALPALPYPLQLGAVLPRSTLHPLLGQNWADGLNLYFRQTGGAPVSVALEDLASPAAAAQRVSQWLAGGTNLVAGIVGSAMARQLGRALDGCPALMIASDGGANIARHDELCPALFRNTLGHWQSSWAMGDWAARNLGPRAFLACSFYESGYDAPYAFRCGFEAAGGEVAETFVAHVPPQTENLPELMAAIKRGAPDMVFALFSGQRAVDFVRAYADAGLAGKVPLAASAFMLDEHLLPGMGAAALGIRSMLGWAPTLRIPENQAFLPAFEQATGRPADGFAVLGYETAHLIAAALEAAGGDLRRSDRIAQALRAVRLDGPRGELAVDPVTQEVLSPLYLRQVQHRGGALVNRVIGLARPVPAADERLTALRQAERTGWTHPYLGL